MPAVAGNRERKMSREIRMNVVVNTENDDVIMNEVQKVVAESVKDTMDRLRTKTQDAFNECWSNVIAVNEENKQRVTNDLKSLVTTVLYNKIRGQLKKEDDKYSDIPCLDRDSVASQNTRAVRTVLKAVYKNLLENNMVLANQNMEDGLNINVNDYMQFIKLLDNTLASKARGYGGFESKFIALALYNGLLSNKAIKNIEYNIRKEFKSYVESKENLA